MKAKNYINGLAALLLCTACNNEELPQQDSQSDEIAFGAMLQTSTAIETRGIGNNSGQTEALPYIYGIHVRKMESPNPLNRNYKVKNGNKGTLELENKDTALKWTDAEKTNNTDIHFYAWTEPEGVTISENAATGTIDFGDKKGNRAPRAENEDDKHKMNNTYYTPLELFISAHTTGSYEDNPTIWLPFTHQVAKVGIMIYNWNNERISDNSGVSIQFPFIKQKWNIEQKQTEGGNAFYVTTPCEGTNDPLELTMDKLHLISEDKRRIFYLPPMVDDYDFARAGDFVITYDGEKYYGTLNALSIKQLNAGEYMKCRIDLNKNYGTGVGATIQEWVFAKETEAPANPYQGIYTVDDLKDLRDYLTSTDGSKTLSESLYIKDGDKKIIRLYNDLTLSDKEWSLELEDNMIFDGLGHIVTVPSGKSLFGEVSATAGDKKIAINNVRLEGAGQLAASLENVSVHNCHANGTGNLVGTAKGTTKFDFCSAETSADNNITLMGSAEGNNVTVKNSFVASSATGFVANNSGTITVKNSFIIATSNKSAYWSTDATSGNNKTEFTIDSNNVTATTVTISGTPTRLIDLLNAGSKDTDNQWVYVYGKTYPVMRIK